MDSFMDVVLVFKDGELGVSVMRSLRALNPHWEIRIAGDESDANDIMLERSPDAIVSDICESAVVANAFWCEMDKVAPAAFRIEYLHDIDEDQALRATEHAHRVATASVEPQKLASMIIDGVFLLKNLEDESLRKFIASVGELPKPTEKLQLVLDMIGDPNVSLGDFQSLLEEEPTLATSIMRIANTPFFGGGQTSNLFDAVQSMGLNVVQAVLVGELARSSVSIPKQTWSVVEHVVDGCQDSMVSCLRLYRDFYRKECNRGDAITACLLQDIGKLVFLSCLPDEYLEVLNQCEGEEANIIELESSRFGCDHAQLGGVLLNLWGIPEEIVTAVGLHHHRRYVSSNPRGLAGLLFMAGQSALYQSESPDYFFAPKEPEAFIRGIDAELADGVFPSDET